jgi:hypothetical protein
MNNLFDIIKIIITDPKSYREISSLDKKKNYFMINRRFSINHPLQGQFLNHIKLNFEEAVDVWHRFMSFKYKYTPNWIYTKGVKKAKEKKEKQISISKDIISEYCKRNRLETKTIYEALEFFPKETEKELKEFSKGMK